MPHLMVEYSTNLEQYVDIDELMLMIHESALKTGVFPLGGIRTRAEPRDKYLIADRDPDNMFIHVLARIGHGRPLEVRKEAGEKIFADLCNFLAEIYASHTLNISFDIQEIDPVVTFKKNNTHEKLKAKEKLK